MGTSISIDFSYGIQITESNICYFPWSVCVESDVDYWYDSQHSFMEDFEKWAPDDCPLEVDCWGDYRWGDDYYILKVKGLDQSSYGDILIPNLNVIDAEAGTIGKATEWAKEHDIDFSGAQWMIVPAYG